MMRDPRDITIHARATIRGLFFPEPKYEMMIPKMAAETS